MIDLGNNFSPRNKHGHNSTWFIQNYFLKLWLLLFNYSTQAIWVRVLDLQSKFYDHKILTRVGNILGKLLKIDACTSSTTRGKYVCIGGGVRDYKKGVQNLESN